MRPVRLLSSFVPALCATMLACAKFSSSGEDGGTAPGVADAASPAGAITLVNPGFELPDCSGWLGNDVALSSAPGAGRNGSKSACRACATGLSTWSLFQATAGKVVSPGSVVEGRAWVRSDPDAAAPDDMTLRLYLAEEGTGFRTADGAGAGGTALRSLNDTWQEIGVTWAIDSDAGTALEVNVVGHGTGCCVLVDDVTLTRD